MSGESLTKDQLREQLIANGIQPPPATAKKSVFVELYNNNVINSHGQFSSDDDVHVVSYSGRRTKKAAGDATISMSTIDEADENTVTEVQAIVKPERNQSRTRYEKYMPSFWCSENTMKETSDEKRVEKQAVEQDGIEDLNSLSNTEIAAKLKELGVKPGPIGQTTRNVYLKKLSKLLSSNSAEQDANAKEEKYSDEETEEEAVPTVPVTRSSSRRRTMLIADNPPQVSSRRSLSLSNRTSISNAPVVKSSSSSMNKRRSMAASNQDENISLTQPTFYKSTPNLSYFSPKWKPTKPSKPRNETLVIKPSTLSPIPSIITAPPSELTPSWVNVSLSEVVNKSLTQSSDSGGFTLEKFSDNEEPFDIVDEETIAESSYNNTVVHKADVSHSTTLTQESRMSKNLTPVEKRSKNGIPHKPPSKMVGFSSPDFAAHARTSTRYETIVSPNHPPSSYIKRAQNVCGSATRRRPLRKTTFVPKTPEKIEISEQQSDGTPKPKEEEKQLVPEKRWIPLWVQIIITLILVVFFYLVLQYLEGNPPLPSLPSKSGKQ